MNLFRQILTNKKNILTISTSNEKIVKHFEKQSNCADLIIDQINQDRLYDRFLEGKDNLTVIDIGGNIGLFSLYAQDGAKAVYSIEPTPDHFYILKELTKDYPNIHPLNYALSNKNDVVDFYINNENSTMNSLANEYGQKIQVKTKTLRQIIDDHNITHVDFVKCDIEGSEMIAFNDETVGAVKDIVDAWFLEVHATIPADTYDGWHYNINFNRELLFDLFSRNGYKVENYKIDGLFIYK